MTLKSLLVRPWLTVALLALIMITRTNGSSVLIDAPDVTLAAFFVAGMWAASALVFGLLFGACVAADLLSFALGVSDWCFTPAYVFLVPTYACLWYAGYVCRNTDYLRIVGAAKLVACFLLACVGAYFISSHSFFLFSGRFAPTLTALDYWRGIMRYFPMYIGWASSYAVLALAIAAIARAVVSRSAVDSSGR